jgi:endoglucanase
MAFRVFLFANAVAAIATPGHSNQIPAANITAKKNFKFFGINESGPEFGEKNFTGVKNKEVRSTPTV